ncbi:stage III sporulation protein AE [Lachnotalea glycerini]|uniref:Stage III sporulation protein AE n=1 Tax=Lachnotalea glycerini TaxID=1763509 RepID=A0A255ILA0_9FIRM|nr:stage III sporulation protein AE [Lachnotalea glycerini]PXV86304.1 stage III sporulation protein AE [Lachnotalea glycerini]RDY30396.1 stage III sporulation protein AF [Lachnotalea glycerini]
MNRGFILLATILLLAGGKVYAAEADMSITDSSEFNDINKSLDLLLDGDEVDFKEMIVNIIKGKEPLNVETLLQTLVNKAFGQISYVKKTILHIMIIAIAAAILNNFSSVFNNNQIADISFYVVYMLLLTVLMKSFVSVTTIAESAVNSLIEFMQSLVPAYFLALNVAGKTTTAMIFYQVILMIITGIHLLFSRFILPLINVYIVLMLVNNLSKEDFLSRLAQLLKGTIEWLLKAMLTVVVGFNVIQSLVAPAIDSFRTTALNKTVSAIPGVGNAVNAVTDMVIGSAVIIKNGVGVAALIVLIVISLVPLIQLWTFSVLYKLAAAVIQPVSDARMVSSIGSVSDAVKLLIKVLTTSLILFMITIAIVTATTTTAV